MDNKDKLVVIARYASDIEAHIALGVLRTHGIDCVLNNEIISSVMAIPSADFDQIRLLVRAEDVDEALALIRPWYPTVLFHSTVVSVPAHFKFNFTGLPAIGKIAVPYVLAGPSLNFNTSSKSCEVTRSYHQQLTVVNGDIGVGVEFFKHLQVVATYSMSLNNVLRNTGKDKTVECAGFKSHNWYFTLGYLF